MTEISASIELARWIDLAREADFDLGHARVRPSACEVEAVGGRIRLQPRVMQVLTALARAEGQVVSRDALVASCWGGLTVGDDAINRCIQRLRRLAETEAPGAYGIETLPRIGYRLTRAGVAGPYETIAPNGTTRRPRLGSRIVLGSVVGLVVVAIAAALVWGGLQRARAAAPWSNQDNRDTYFIAPVRATGDATLAAYADQFKSALASRFTPALSDPRLWLNAGPGAKPPAQYAVGLEFHRSDQGVTTRVTLREQATGAVLNVGEVSDVLGTAPAFTAVWHVSDLVKSSGMRRSATLVRAIPAAHRDAHDLVILAHAVPSGSDHVAEAIDLLEKARKLSPGEYQVNSLLAAKLDERALDVSSPSAGADIARAKAIAEDLLRDDPTDYWGLIVMADSYLLQGRWEDCVVAADRVLAVKPDDPFALEDKVQAQLALGAFDDSERTLGHLVLFQATYDQVEYPRFAGQLRFHQGRAREAATLLRQAVQAVQAAAPGNLRTPALAGLRLYLAAAEVEAGRPDDARADLADFRAAVPQVRGPSDFARWNDAIRFPLTDLPRLQANLAKIGWTDR